MKKYFITTYGCQLNEHESEKLAGMLHTLGYEKTDNKELADVIIFNTCAIREGAENKALGNIGALKPMKKRKPNLIIAVCGCMTQQKKRAEYLTKKFPFVNIIFGTHNLHKFKDYLIKFEKNSTKVFEVWDKEVLENVETEIIPDSSTDAKVNIMYGCNNFCSYCIVPYVRGRERSRPFDEIVNEVKALVDKGYKTITLLGQNVNSYKPSFPLLMKELCKIEGEFELKFLTSHPKDLSDDLIDIIANNKKISREVHLPVQSASNKILKAMNRNYTIEHYLEIVKKIKTKIPDVALSTDIIVGFPGETEEDFKQTYNLVKEVEYGTFFGFMYSKRKGTPAAEMDNQIDLSVKRRRLNELFALQKEIVKKRKEKLK